MPASQSLNLANFFGQDTIAITPRLKLTLGLKIENEPYSGIEAMPSARAAWKVTGSVLLWGAISRAVRAPTPVDENIREYSGPTDILNGSRNFAPEVVTVYEAGTRVQASPSASFSISTFYNNYSDLRTIGTSPPGSISFYNLDNGARATVYGVEVWGNYRVTDWWRLSAGFNIQHEQIEFLPGSGIAGKAFVADDPNHQTSLRSSIDLGNGLTWSAGLRYIGALPHPKVADYGEFDTRLGWKVSESVELSLSGSNLLHPHHMEFREDGETDEIPRSFFLETRWRF